MNACINGHKDGMNTKDNNDMNATDNLGRTLFIRGNIDMNTKDTLGLTHIINAILI